ncbi:hypothetical protein WMY93_032682 [Mugilogobius chulae]|uniref:G/T mismatch-specific thymine DNA glycosylase n=1 Tax=Mugilogobius chulae TaxID=88201 RepID=A0AAW0MMX5_9GOBI
MSVCVEGEHAAVSHSRMRTPERVTAKEQQGSSQPTSDSGHFHPSSSSSHFSNPNDPNQTGFYRENTQFYQNYQQNFSPNVEAQSSGEFQELTTYQQENHSQYFQHYPQTHNVESNVYDSYDQAQNGGQFHYNQTQNEGQFNYHQAQNKEQFNYDPRQNEGHFKKKKRGRPSKNASDSCRSFGGKGNAEKETELKPIRRVLSVEEVMSRTLPDVIEDKLDILIIGINPGLMSAYKGHHYPNPGNHFWKCLFLSGFTEKQPEYLDDTSLPQKYGIGFTNMVERTTPGSKDLSRWKQLLEKLQKYKPLIAAFNGKGIYEIFCKETFGVKAKNLEFGLQPYKIPQTETRIFTADVRLWTLPSFFFIVSLLEPKRLKPNRILQRKHTVLPKLSAELQPERRGPVERRVPGVDHAQNGGQFHYNQTQNEGQFNYHQTQNKEQFNYHQTQNKEQFNYDPTQNEGHFSYNQTQNEGQFSYHQTQDERHFTYNQTENGGQYYMNPNEQQRFNVPVKTECEEFVQNPPTATPEKKKRGRPSKNASDSAEASEEKEMQKKKRNLNRFDGLSVEEVMSRTLPDVIEDKLDILIIGINPGLMSAYKGHHYPNPGNHFWKCLFLSGFTEKQLNYLDDTSLPQKYGIGFTNMVERTTPGSKDLSSKEIREGGKQLLEKLQKYKPLIAAFNGKGIYEIFCKETFGVKAKNLEFGLQPYKIPQTETVCFLMPSSSPRCAQFPRAQDKVHFYIKLKELRDGLKGALQSRDVEETQYSFDLQLAKEDAKRLAIKEEQVDPEYESCAGVSTEETKTETKP